MDETEVLVIVPFNERTKRLECLLREVRTYAIGAKILVIDDCSKRNIRKPFGRPRKPLADFSIDHHTNLGYGKSLIDGFRFAVGRRFDYVVTMDADGEHDPRFIFRFLEAVRNCDFVTGTRYHKSSVKATAIPENSLRMNLEITSYLKNRIGLNITDAFCGFRAYTTSCLGKFDLTVQDYGLPLQIWVQASFLGMNIKEISVFADFSSHGKNKYIKTPLDETLTYFESIIEKEMKSFCAR